MVIIKILYILLIIVTAVVAFVIMQIKLNGMKVMDFWKFVKSIPSLDVLYNFSKRYGKMSKQEQIIFLIEAEKIFETFDKVPTPIWEDEYEKYEQILSTYKNIKMLRWAESNS